MNIEKLYYDEYKALMQEVQKQDEAEQASLTEVEKLLKDKKNQYNFQKLYERYKEELGNRHDEVELVKLKVFEELQTEAIALAKEIGANVAISKDKDNQAIVRFVTNMVVLGKDSPHIFKRVLSRLITAADHIWIDTKHVDNEVLVQIEFWFDLCDNEDEIVN